MRSLTVTLLYCMPYGTAKTAAGEDVGNSEGLVVGAGVSIVVGTGVGDVVGTGVVGTGVGIVVGTGVGLVAADNGKNRSDMSHIRQRSIILDRVANQFKK